MWTLTYIQSNFIFLFLFCELSADRSLGRLSPGWKEKDAYCI